jgi:hypothetical protein
MPLPDDLFMDLRTQIAHDRVPHAASFELILCCGAAKKVRNPALLAISRSASRLHGNFTRCEYAPFPPAGG